MKQKNFNRCNECWPIIMPEFEKIETGIKLQQGSLVPNPQTLPRNLRTGETSTAGFFLRSSADAVVCFQTLARN
jgi:hypothetical protein